MRQCERDRISDPVAVCQLEPRKASRAQCLKTAPTGRSHDTAAPDQLEQHHDDRNNQQQM